MVHSGNEANDVLRELSSIRLPFRTPPALYRHSFSGPFRFGLGRLRWCGRRVPDLRPAGRDHRTWQGAADRAGAAGCAGAEIARATSGHAENFGLVNRSDVSAGFFAG